jgi:protein-S-isoprenylcysteine O-methyltransferase Ste14
MLTSVIALTLYLVFFGGIHSFLASSWAKQWAYAQFGVRAKQWYRLGYNLLSLVMAAAGTILFLLLPDQTLYVVPSPWRWLMMGGQLAAAVALYRAFSLNDSRRFMGITQLTEKEPIEHTPLIIRGWYCYVRHPLYTFSLVFIWLNPFMTVNILVLSLFATVYFYVGAILEERRLVETFGDTYRCYQREVPRLIPRLRGCGETTMHPCQ